MSKKMTVKVFKGPQFEQAEKMAYGYLHKVLSDMAMEDPIPDEDSETSIRNQKI